MQGEFFWIRTKMNIDGDADTCFVQGIMAMGACVGTVADANFLVEDYKLLLLDNINALTRAP